MDAVSVETSPENEWIKQRLIDGKVNLCRPDEVIDLTQNSILGTFATGDVNFNSAPIDFLRLPLCICVTSRSDRGQQLRNDGTQIFIRKLETFRDDSPFCHIPRESIFRTEKLP